MLGIGVGGDGATASSSLEELFTVLHVADGFRMVKCRLQQEQEG
jgi:hypothetical protein